MTTAPITNAQQFTAPALAAPRWAYRSMFAAVLCTLGLFLAMPYVDMLSTPSEPQVDVRAVTTVALTPLPLPFPRQAEPPSPAPDAPRERPTLKQPPTHARPPLPELRLDLSPSLGDVGGDFAVPFAFGAGALSPAWKSVFSLKELDTAPTPVVCIPPIYPPHARMRGVEGSVELEFTVGADGQTRDLEAIAPAREGMFVRAARRAVKRWRFKPGMKDGKAVAARVRQKISFKLE